MLLFYRGAGEHDGESFRLSVARRKDNEQVRHTMNLLTEHHGGFGEFIDCSDMQENPDFDNALAELYRQASRHVYEVLAREFTGAYMHGMRLKMIMRNNQLLIAGWQREHGIDSEKGDLAYLGSRFLGSPLAPVVEELLESSFDQLATVIPPIRQRGRVTGMDLRLPS